MLRTQGAIVDLSQAARTREIGALLIAEDPRVRRAMGGLLTAADGFRVVRVIGSVPDALDAAAFGRLDGVDVAVVDLQFSAADSGLGLVTELSARGVKVVVLSDRNTPDALALGSGADVLIGTASDPDCVLKAIKEVVGGQGEACPPNGSLSLGRQVESGE